MNRINHPLTVVAVLCTALSGCGTLQTSATDAKSPRVTSLTQQRVSAVRDAEFELALNAFAAKDYQKALALWQPLANRGVSGAQTAIAYLYATGLGVPQNDAEALDWFTKAAQQGDPDAQNNLGYMYAKGLGTKPSRDQAIRWYLEAAKRGHRVAQQNLFALNNDGLERKVLAPASAEAVQLKAEAGEALYQFLYGMSFLVGNGAQDIDEFAALNWIQRAADQNFAAAEYQLGQFYLHGRSVPQDRDRAYYWISRAADKKYSPATAWMQTAKSQRAGARAPRPTTPVASTQYE